MSDCSLLTEIIVHKGTTGHQELKAGITVRVKVIKGENLVKIVEFQVRWWPKTQFCCLVARVRKKCTLRLSLCVFGEDATSGSNLRFHRSAARGSHCEGRRAGLYRGHEVSHLKTDKIGIDEFAWSWVASQRHVFFTTEFTKSIFLSYCNPGNFSKLINIVN